VSEHVANVEEWVPVRGYEGLYEVSNLGRVKSLKRVVTRPPCGKSLRPSTTTYHEKILRTARRGMYPAAQLNYGGIGKSVNVHRLVAEHFIPGSGQVVRHLDGNPNNCAASNLAWGTYKDNEDDKSRHGRTPRGELHHNSTLTLEVVQEVKRLIGIDRSDLRISRTTGVARSTVYLIRNNLAWVDQ